MSDFLYLPYTGLDALFNNLKQLGYTCIAPQVREGSIKYDEIGSSKNLPWGYTDSQEPGYYRIKHNEEIHKCFAWTVPVESVKPMLFKAKETVWKVERNASAKLEFKPVTVVNKPLAIFGVRPCDLRAIYIQDKVFVHNDYSDPRYTKRRQSLFLIAMNCTDCHSNCFCLSTGGSPRATNNYDLAMIEIDQGFLVEIGSDKGREALNCLNLKDATDSQESEALEAIKKPIQKQNKAILPQEQVINGLKNNMDHPRWDDVAKRCLSCGNCTQACPTCFCHSEKDYPSLNSEKSEHSKEWDSCFSIDHSYTHGHIYRNTIKYRYRQWLTHKFSTWHDQFEVEGCVGCGRCITWCPVKIDVTEEINSICKKE